MRGGEDVPVGVRAGGGADCEGGREKGGACEGRGFGFPARRWAGPLSPRVWLGSPGVERRGRAGGRARSLPTPVPLSRRLSAAAAAPQPAPRPVNWLLLHSCFALSMQERRGRGQAKPHRACGMSPPSRLSCQPNPSLSLSARPSHTLRQRPPPSRPPNVASLPSTRQDQGVDGHAQRAAADGGAQGGHLGCVREQRAALARGRGGRCCSCCRC